MADRVRERFNGWQIVADNLGELADLRGKGVHYGQELQQELEKDDVAAARDLASDAIRAVAFVVDSARSPTGAPEADIV